MVAALVPDPEWCARSGDPCNFANLAHDHDYRAALGAAVERVNKDLSQIERIRRFIIADEPFSIENEQLRSEEHTSELQSLMRISYAVFCLKKNKYHKLQISYNQLLTTNNKI